MQDRKHTKEAHSKLTSYLNFGAYAWEVDPALFPAEGGDQVTLSSLHPRDDEKDTVLAILDVTEGLLGYLVARCMEGRPLVEGEEVEQLEEVGWKSPLEGWQGVLLALLNGLMVRPKPYRSGLAERSSPTRVPPRPTASPVPLELGAAGRPAR